MVQLTYPGVYVQEIPSGVQTITGVSTAIAAFVDYFPYGPVDKPTLVQSWSEFERYFGGLDSDSIASYCIQQFFINGGAQAHIVRVAEGTAKKAETAFGKTAAAVADEDEDDAGEEAPPSPDSEVIIRARSQGTWGNNIRLRVESLDATAKTFNLVVERLLAGEDKDLKDAKIVASEKHVGLSMKLSEPRNFFEVLNEASELVEVDETSVGNDFTELKGLTQVADLVGDSTKYQNLYKLTNGHNGGALTAKLVTDGMKLLAKVDLFNILCLPIAGEDLKLNAGTIYGEAKIFCEKKRAFLLVDIPEDTDREGVNKFKEDNLSNIRSRNAALFFPRVTVADPLNSYRPKSIPVSGSIAGLFSRIDGTRGVWKAPAGVEAIISGIVKLDEEITDDQNGTLNPLAINCLRRFPVYGTINWGARTLVGSDQEGSEWKYIPVRRLALYIEESLFRGTKWVVFEPNDEPLWAQIRQSVGAFMMDLFRQGAFQGSTPSQAFYVRCDGTTTLAIDRERGVVNIEVGFAALKPAEFVVLKFQQIAATANA